MRTIDSAMDVAREVSKATEASIVAQLNDFISRGLIEVKMGPMSFVRDSFHGNTVTVSQTCELVLKDKEYIERLENENKKLKELLFKMQEALK